MPRRAPSPAVSENGVDITEALVENGSDSEADYQHPDRKARQEGIPDLEESDSDAGFIADTQAAANRKNPHLKSKSAKKGGGFQAMGLNANLLKAITRKGFSVPTPIQRKTIPLVNDGQDVVGMARTGSGENGGFRGPHGGKIEESQCKGWGEGVDIVAVERARAADAEGR